MRKFAPAVAVVGLAAAVLAGVGVLWLRFQVAPGESSAAARRMAFTGDLLNYYFGMTEQTLRRLATGELPLWNPEACSGIPLLATGQVAAFYPVTWLGLLLPLERALPLELFAQCVVGGWLAAWLFRAWGSSRYAAGFGGIAFVFACLLGQTFWPPVVATLMWAPWVLLCVERLCQNPRLRWGLGLAGGVTAQILAGFPQMLAYTFLLASALALLRLWEAYAGAGRSAGALARRLGALASAVLLGVGLAAVQLLPTLELVGQSVRDAPLTPEQVHYLNALQPHRAGDVLRTALDPSPKLPAFDFGRGGGYLGISTLIWVALGLAVGWRSPRTWLLLGLGALTLLLSDGYLGAARGLYEGYASLPFLGSFRTPERLRWIPFFCAIALAVGGLDALVRPPETLRERRTLLAVVAGVTATTLGLLAAGLGPAGAAWRLAPAALVAAALLQWPARRWRSAALAGLAVWMLADLALATGAYGSLRSLPSELARGFHAGPHTLSLERLARERRAVGGMRLELVGFLPHVAAAPSNGIERIACYEPLTPSAWVALSEDLTQKTSRGASLVRLDPREFPTLYDVTSVARVLVGGRDGGVVGLDNEDALPRAYLAGVRGRVERDTALRRVASSDFDLHSGVLLEPAASSSEAGPARIAPARIVDYAPERVVVEALAEQSALLVLTDTFYPGWRALVDGEPARIWRANGLHRAVAVGPGRHRVVFEYRPGSFRLGAAVSLASLAIAGAAIFFARRKTS